VRQVVDLVRGKGVSDALAMLRFAPQSAAQPVSKVVRSASANAEHNFKLNADELFIKAICVDEGPILKRYQPRARGRVDVKRRRTCHITVVVADEKAGPEDLASSGETKVNVKGARKSGRGSRAAAPGPVGRARRTPARKEG
jgi:large subunit ribosomal protein L22